MENPYEKVQSSILSRILANVERLNQSVATLNQELVQINRKNRQLETVGAICENYQRSIEYNLQTTGNLGPPQ